MNQEEMQAVVSPGTGDQSEATNGTPAVQVEQQWKKIPVAEALEMRNEDGSYRYGKLLSDKQRFALIKSARAADARRGSDAVEQLENQLLMGAEIPRSQVEAMFDGRADMTKYRNDALKLYDRISESRQSKERADVRFRSFLEGEKEKAEKKKQADADSVFMCDLLDWEPDANAAERKRQYFERKSAIWMRTAGDYARRKKMIDILDARMNDVEKPDTSYRKNPAYDAVMDTLKKDCFFDRNAEAEKVVGQVLGVELNSPIPEWEAEDDYLDRIARSRIKVEMDTWFMAHPNATETEAWNAYRQIHDRWTKEEAARLMTEFMNGRKR